MSPKDEIAAERRRLEARAKKGDLEALLDLAALALDTVSDDDEKANRAAATLVKDGIEKCRAAGQFVDEAWELAAESIIAWSAAWPEKETLAAVEKDLGSAHPLASLVRGLLAFYAARWEDAVDALEGPGEDALSLHYLGCAFERLGRAEKADLALAKAAALDPERFVEPVRTSAGDFAACLESALAELPPAIRAAIEARCSIAVEDFPPDAAVQQGLDPLSLGAFSGTDLSEDRTGQDEVVLYKKNLEKFAPSRDELKEEIRVTVLHEVGHVLGFDEEGVDDLGLA